MSAKTRLAFLRAKLHRDDEMLRREAWLANAPARETAKILLPFTSKVAHQVQRPSPDEA